VHYDVPFHRIGEREDQDTELLFDVLSNSGLRVANGQAISLQADNIVCWFRRPPPNIVGSLASRDFPGESILFPRFNENSLLYDSMNINYKYYLATFFDLVLDNPAIRLGSYKKTGLNKLEVLDIAQKHGINIPDSIVTNKKSDLEAFFEKHEQGVICKTLYEIITPIGVIEEGFSIRCLTDRVDSVEEIPSAFFPTLFQQNIAKRYELRVFYMKGICYTAAMFTQTNEKTQTDFRNYDDEQPTRIIPYQLDTELEQQIQALMNEVGLDSGSIDFIKGQDNNYYFLEINPVGQFGFISAPCNFNLPKRIADKLTAMYHGEVSH
jgi:ATP-GRASP peptide maturase of grasp-with-spasm system